MALMKTLILALCIGHSAVLELPPRRRARLFSYMWCWVLLGHFPSFRPVVDALGSRDVLFKGWCQSSRAPEARIHNHARYMHGKDRNMRQCDMVLAAGAQKRGKGRTRFVARLFTGGGTCGGPIHQLGSTGFRRGGKYINAFPANRNPFQDFYSIPR